MNTRKRRIARHHRKARKNFDKVIQQVQSGELPLKTLHQRPTFLSRLPRKELSPARKASLNARLAREFKGALAKDRKTASEEIVTLRLLLGC